MEIFGTIHEIGETNTVSDSFKKRDLIVVFAENPEYPEYIKFETIQDKVELLDEFQVGDEVTVHFNLRGRPWTDKSGKTSYFNSLVAWRIVGETSEGQEEYETPDSVDETGGEGDLPF